MLYKLLVVLFLCIVAACGSNDPPSKEVYLQESWESIQVGGNVGFFHLQCDKGKTDPNNLSNGVTTSPGSSWAPIGRAIGDLSVKDGALQIYSVQPKGGYALLNPKQFPKDTPVVVETTIDLKDHPGAWIGLALIQEESDYRELSFRWSNGTMSSMLYAPCFLEVIREEKPGPKKVKIIYQPSTGFEFYVDGILIYFEPITNNGAEFVGPFYLGIYVVNVEAEAGLISPGIVEATVGEIVVSEF